MHGNMHKRSNKSIKNATFCLMVLCSALRNHLWGWWRNPLEALLQKVYTIKFVNQTDLCHIAILKNVKAEARLAQKVRSPRVTRVRLPLMFDVLPCWPPWDQQVSHQMWIWEIHPAQAMKHASQEILWNWGKNLPEIRNRGTSEPTKRTDIVKRTK